MAVGGLVRHEWEASLLLATARRWDARRVVSSSVNGTRLLLSHSLISPTVTASSASSASVVATATAEVAVPHTPVTLLFASSPLQLLARSKSRWGLSILHRRTSEQQRFPALRRRAITPSS